MYDDGRYLERTKTWHVEDSPWKASQIAELLTRNNLQPQRVIEVGCGAGRVLDGLAQLPSLEQTEFVGYDLSQQAIDLCPSDSSSSVSYICGDPLSDTNETFDLLLAIDVFEHVPDYMGFLESCSSKADFKIYHIPLDLHVSAVVRTSLNRQRDTIGHLHYFTLETALATLEATGHSVIDHFFTCGAIQNLGDNRTLGRVVAAAPRWAASKLSPALGARFLGGFSAMVLTT